MSVALLSLFLYFSIFYYQHARSGQRVLPAPPVEVATSTQNTSEGDGGEGSTSTPAIPVSTVPCRVSGCSGEICSEGSLVSICIYKPEYACYRTAKCERQNTGVCGWTETPELLACVVEKQNDGRIVAPQ